jgi:hypothetical protein
MRTGLIDVKNEEKSSKQEIIRHRQREKRLA